VFGTDRLAPRPHADSQKDGAHFLDWRRELHVEVPVRDALYWRADAVRTTIERTLAELTDDIWQFEFVESRPLSRGAKQMRLQSSDGRPVALFSGGLDSLAGVLLHARAHGRLPWLVSVSSNSHVRQQQNNLIQSLQQHLRQVPEKLLFEIHNAGVEPRDLDKKQRARSFLYFVVAAVVARRLDVNEVIVLENGVTSLNVPISPILTSTRVTRTTHPLVLFAFEEMIRVVLEWPAFRMKSPHIHSTKAEMVGAVADSRTLIAGTVSCARVRTGSWCGICTACILRRQVLWAAELADIDLAERDKRYTCDIFKSFADETIPEARRWYFLATLDHVARMLRDRNLFAREPSLLLVASAQAARMGTNPTEEMQKIIDMHGRYVTEWLLMLDRAQSEYPGLKPILTALTANWEVSS
jgi:7-cyano-7-deazaguanine synthase in queuosine biosynthesis